MGVGDAYNWLRVMFSGGLCCVDYVETSSFTIKEVLMCLIVFISSINQDVAFWKCCLKEE
jgi:hypothetical protein